MLDIMLKINGAEELPSWAVVEGQDERGQKYMGCWLLGGLALCTAGPNEVKRGALLAKPAQRVSALHMMLGYNNIDRATAKGVSESAMSQRNGRALEAVGANNWEGIFKILATFRPPELVVVQRIPQGVFPSIKKTALRTIYGLNNDLPTAQVAKDGRVTADVVKERLENVHRELFGPGLTGDRHSHARVGAAAILAGVGEYESWPIASWPDACGALTLREYTESPSS